MKSFKIVSFLVLLLILHLFLSCRNASDENKMENVFNENERSMNIVVNERRDDDFTTKESLLFDYLPTSTSNQIIAHDNYTLSYVEKYEQAEWVAYELKNVRSKNHFKRPFFIVDPKVKTQSADWRNYKKSGYDKGHICPAGDMTFSRKAYDDTFYTSNISPQLHSFNVGVWNRLEQKTRYWASKDDGLYVVSGGVLKKGMKTIGKERVAVPDYFYKVLLDTSNGQYKIIAFLVPHAKSDKPLYEFVVSVNSLEKITGIDFFPKLNDVIENRLEQQTDYKGWSF